MSSSDNNNDNRNNNPYSNVVDNYVKYVENVEATIGKDNWLAQKIKRVWMREMIKHQTIFAKVFSADPKLLEEAKREFNATLYDLEHPSSQLDEQNR